MKRDDDIINGLHKVREATGRAHGFDVHRIAAAIREHERSSGRPIVREDRPKRAGRPRAS
jgi:hypothetical protein